MNSIKAIKIFSAKEEMKKKKKKIKIKLEANDRKEHEKQAIKYDKKAICV